MLSYKYHVIKIECIESFFVFYFFFLLFYIYIHIFFTLKMKEGTIVLGDNKKKGKKIKKQDIPCGLLDVASQANGRLTSACKNFFNDQIGEKKK